MINSKRVVAALACLSIAVNAGPCKPHPTGVTSELATSASSQLSIIESTSVATVVTETESTTFATTTTVSEDLSSTVEASVTKGSSETTGTITTAAATTTAAAEESCNNQIYRGQAYKDSYSMTQLDSDADCWDTCVQDNNCKSWRFEDDTLCHLYSQELADFSSPTNELDSLIGSRNCSPRDYRPCNDNIGFGYIEQEPFKGQAGVPLERECAQLCMKTAECNVWQYDSLAQKCNLFRDILETIFTPQVGAPQGSKIMLAGSRSCSSDYFKPELGPCNGQISFRNTWWSGYRTFSQYNSVPLCARACSIDPVCQTWTVNGGADCSFLEDEYESNSEDFASKGSRNCGVS